MSLIDKTYFVLDLDIPNTTEPNVESTLNKFILKWEPRFLKELFGASLYADFMAGIQVDPMDEIWSNILYGAGAWRGLIQLDDDVVSTVLASGDLSVVVGRGQDDYDPLPNGNTTIIPPQFVGRLFRFSQRGYGKFDPEEISIDDNVLTLPEGFVFSEGDRYFYEAPASLKIETTTGLKTSIIANYIYYRWMRKNATTTMGLGEGKPQVENATPTDNMRKMCDAWNEMAEGVIELYDYLDLYTITYPTWDYYWRFGYRDAYGKFYGNNLVKPINVFNL